MEKYIAVWLDRDHAEIISFEENGVKSIRVDSNILQSGFTEGSVLPSSRSIPGPASDKSVKDAYDDELSSYFNEIAVHLIGAEGIYIFGPAKTKVMLYKMLYEHNDFRDKLWAVDRAENLTLEEIRAKARKFFENEGMLTSKSSSELQTRS